MRELTRLSALQAAQYDMYALQLQARSRLRLAARAAPTFCAVVLRLTTRDALQEEEFQRAASQDADMIAALALAAGCDVSVAAQAAGLCDNDSARAREIALADAVRAALVAADAALALRLSFEEPDEVDNEVR